MTQQDAGRAVAAWGGELVKPPFLLSVIAIAVTGLWWVHDQKSRVELAAEAQRVRIDQLAGQVSELRTIAAQAVAENGDQRTAIALLVQSVQTDRVRTDQQIDRLVRVQERQSADISRLLLFLPPTVTPRQQGQDTPRAAPEISPALANQDT